MNSVKLIYFKGCPEAGKLRSALFRAGISNYQEVLQDELPKGHSYLKVSSPSVMKDDELIYGVRTCNESSSCTYDMISPPDEEKLVLRLKELTKS